MTQYFKGDSNELAIEAAGLPAFDACSVELDSFFENCYEAADFLLMLYDAGRMPFSQRVGRDDFVTFLNKAMPNFPVTGTFEAYILLLSAIFGELSLIEFDVTDPGKISILVNASDAILSTAIARELDGGDYIDSPLVTDDDENIVYVSIPKIDSEDKLKKLLSEIIPAGIVADIQLSFFTISFFVADESGFLNPIIDSDGNNIVFFEQA